MVEAVFTGNFGQLIAGLVALGYEEEPRFLAGDIRSIDREIAATSYCTQCSGPVSYVGLRNTKSGKRRSFIYCVACDHVEEF